MENVTSNAGEGTVDSGSQMDGERDGSIEVGSMAPSFDDFDSIASTRSKVAEVKAKRNEASKESKKTGESVPQRTEDEVKGKPEKKEEPKEEKVEVEKPEVEEQNQKVAKNDSKKITAKFGDEQVDLDPSSKIPVKINGEIQEVDLQEIINNYSGKVAFDKKFTELDKERKGFKGERDTLFNHLKTFKQKLAEGKPQDALFYLVDIVGADRYNFKKGLRDSLMPEVLDYAQMDEQQRNAYEAMEENKFLKERDRSFQDKSKQEQAYSALKAQIDQVREASQISEEEFDSAYNEVVSIFGQRGMDTKAITPKYVADYKISMRNLDRVGSILTNIDPELKTDEKLLSGLSEIMLEDKSLTDEEIRKLVLEYTGVPQKLEVLTQKANVKVQQNQPAKRGKTPQFFEDYDN